MTPVKSSNVAAVNFSASDKIKGTLTVRFLNGAEWTYDNVTARQHQEMMKADSVGTWLRENLVKRPIAHPARKVEVKPKKK